MTEQISPDGQWRWDGTQWVPHTYGVQPWPGPPPAPTDTLAVVSLVSSVLWLGGLGSLVGVITGHLARRNARREQRPTSGLATAGLVIGYLGLVGMALLVAVVVALGFTVVHAVHDDPTFDLYLVSGCETSFHDSHDRYGSLEELRSDGCFVNAFRADVEVVRYTATDYCLKGTKRDSVRYYAPSTGVTRASCE